MEIRSLRTQNAKHFQIDAQNRLCLLSPVGSPLHYWSEQSGWEDFICELAPTYIHEDIPLSVSCTTHGLNTTIAIEPSSGESVVVAGRALYLRWVGPSVSTSAGTSFPTHSYFQSSSHDTALIVHDAHIPFRSQYTVLPNKLKHDIILDTPPTVSQAAAHVNLTFTWLLYFPSGANVYVHPVSSDEPQNLDALTFTDPVLDESLRIDRISVTDAAGQTYAESGTSSAFYILTPLGPGMASLELHITVPASGVVYPLTIDPTTYLYPGGTGACNGATAGSVRDDNCGSTALHVRWDRSLVSCNFGSYNRAHSAAIFSGASQTFPQNASLSSAYLYYSFATVPNGSNHDIVVAPASPWAACQALALLNCSNPSIPTLYTMSTSAAGIGSMGTMAANLNPALFTV